MTRQTATPRKYHNQPVEYDGIRFDSKAEGLRYLSLRSDLWRGMIRDLEVHPRYVFDVDGVRVTSYRPDFRYVVIETGQTVVEDVKSSPTVTEAYRIRKKLMQAMYGVTVVEIMP